MWKIHVISSLIAMQNAQIRISIVKKKEKKFT